MSIYIVTYDLNKESDESADYQKLLNLIKAEGSWARLSESCYLVESECSAVELRNRYREALDNNDKLYVGQATAPAAWFGYSDDVTKWIKTKL